MVDDFLTRYFFSESATGLELVNGEQQFLVGSSPISSQPSNAASQNGIIQQQ